MDVSKVSQVIGLLTPTIIIAVIGVGIYTALNMPADPSADTSQLEIGDSISADAAMAALG